VCLIRLAIGSVGPGAVLSAYVTASFPMRLVLIKAHRFGHLRVFFLFFQSDQADSESDRYWEIRIRIRMRTSTKTHVCWLIC